MSHVAKVKTVFKKFTDPYGFTDEEIYTTRYGAMVALDNVKFLVKSKSDESLAKVKTLKYTKTGAIDVKDRVGIVQLHEVYDNPSQAIGKALDNIVSAYKWARFSTAEAKASILKGEDWITQKPFNINVPTINTQKVISLPTNVIKTSTSARTNVTWGAKWYLEWLADYKILQAAKSITNIPVLPSLDD